MTISAILPVYDRAQITFTHGEGAYLFSDKGERYLDFLSGIAVTALGHAHPHLVKTLQEQSSKLWHISNLFYSEGIKKLSQRLVDATFADSVFFSNSGTEAIEGGIKAIRKYFDEAGKPDKYRIITFNGAFHGRTFGAMAATGTEKILEGFEPKLEGFDKVALNLEAVKKAITTQTAAILVEPVQGEGGILPLSADFLKSLRKICDENELLLFFDEIQCGVGRTGKLFAYEHFAVEPDIMAIAKGIGAGFPMGAILFKEHVAKALKTGSHGTTFGGNPLAMAVGNAVLDIVLEEKFLKNVTAVGNFLKEKLLELQKRYPDIIEEVRGLGLMLGLKFTENCKNTDFKNKLLEHKMLTYIAGDNVVRLLPPLIIGKEHVDEAVGIIEKALKEIS